MLRVGRPKTTAPLTRETPGEIASPRLVGDARRPLDLCRPAAISGACESISQLAFATRRSLSFACAVVSSLPGERKWRRSRKGWPAPHRIGNAL